MLNNKSQSSICESCSEKIDRYGFICLDLMNEVCENTLKFKTCCYHEYDSDQHIRLIIGFLESKQLLLTTDIYNPYVLILPNTSIGKYDQNRKVFCWCKSKKL